MRNNDSLKGISERKMHKHLFYTELFLCSPYGVCVAQGLEVKHKENGN